jgi:hypothetical protein
VLFDQVVFKHQRFQLALAEDCLKVVDFLHHRQNLGRVVSRRLKIIPHAVFERNRFADIDNPALAEHPITARAVGQLPEFFRDAIVQRRDPPFPSDA